MTFKTWINTYRNVLVLSSVQIWVSAVELVIAEAPVG